MSSSIFPPMCRSPFSNSCLEIPSTKYTHTTSIELESSQSTEPLEITIEIRLQGWYKLYVEPIRGYLPVTMDDEYMVSPKFTYNFKVPLFLFADPSSFPTISFCHDSYITNQLSKLPISSSLVQYLKPHVVESSFSSVKMNPTKFKLVFDVKAVKIDLANHEECDSYRRRGFV